MFFNHPVSEYMTREVETVSPGTALPFIAAILERWNFSSVPVVDDAGAVVGVVSRTDLLRVGRIETARSPRGNALRLPPRIAEEVMTHGAHVVAPHTPLARAAAMMWTHRVHRVFVVSEGQLIGVLSTADIAAAVRDARVEDTIDTIMTSPIVAVATTDTITTAMARLETAHVTGLVVMDEGWPVGTFTQVEALASRGLPEDTIVDDVFDQAVICLPTNSRIHRVAAQAARLAVRRVVVCHQREAIGIVSGLDFARLAAGGQGRFGVDEPSPKG
jgi:CBS domain-containing protein